MATRRGHVGKTDLTPEEKISAAYCHLLMGLAQQDIAALYHVNSGRVAEAITAVRRAVGWRGNHKGEGNVAKPKQGDPGGLHPRQTAPEG